MNELLYAFQVFFSHFTSETLHWVPWEWQLEYEQKQRWQQLQKAAHETDDAGQQAVLIKMQREDVLQQYNDVQDLIAGEIDAAKAAQGKDQDEEDRHNVNIQRYSLQLSKLDETVKQLDALAQNAFAGHKQLINEILTTRSDMTVQAAVDSAELASNKAAHAQQRLEQFRRTVSGLIPEGAGAAAVSTRMREETRKLTARTTSQKALTDAWLDQRDASRRAQAARTGAVVNARIAQMMKDKGYTPTAAAPAQTATATDSKTNSAS